MTAPYRSFDPLLSPRDAREMVALCERFGSYGMYSEEGLNEGIGEGLPQRFDAAFNFVKTGGRFGRMEDLEVLAARTNYFRETYAYIPRDTDAHIPRDTDAHIPRDTDAHIPRDTDAHGDHVSAPGIEPFLHHEGFVQAAREIHGRPIVVPAIVYANLLVPGQELAVHTDVPEFRGANRKIHPQWLLVVMHHSGLFDAWRMPVATAVSWFHDARGGAFAFYPDGAEGEPVAHEVRFDTAVILDTDSVFHGVDRVQQTSEEMPRLRPGMRLVAEGGGQWSVRDGDAVVSRYRWEEMRFSVSWKAYCFRDEDERRRWQEGSDDLATDTILDTLDADLRRRGRLEGPRPDGRDFAMMLVDEYVRFPKPRPPAV